MVLFCVCSGYHFHQPQLKLENGYNGHYCLCNFPSLWLYRSKPLREGNGRGKNPLNRTLANVESTPEKRKNVHLVRSVFKSFQIFFSKLMLLRPNADFLISWEIQETGRECVSCTLQWLAYLLLLSYGEQNVSSNSIDLRYANVTLQIAYNKELIITRLKPPPHQSCYSCFPL